MGGFHGSWMEKLNQRRTRRPNRKVAHNSEQSNSESQLFSSSPLNRAPSAASAFDIAPHRISFTSLPAPSFDIRPSTMAPHPLDLPYEKYLEAIRDDPDLIPHPDDYKRLAVIKQGRVGKGSEAKVINESFTRNAKRELAKAMRCAGIVHGPYPRQFSDSVAGQRERIDDDLKRLQLRELWFKDQPTWNRDTARGIMECSMLLDNEPLPEEIHQSMRNKKGETIDPPKPKIYRAVGPILDENKYFEIYYNILATNYGGKDKLDKAEKIMWDSYHQANTAWRKYKNQQAWERKNRSNAAALAAIAAPPPPPPSAVAAAVAALPPSPPSAAAAVVVPPSASRTVASVGGGSVPSAASARAPGSFLRLANHQDHYGVPLPGSEVSTPLRQQGGTSGAPPALVSNGSSAVDSRKRERTHAGEEDGKPAAKRTSPANSGGVRFEDPVEVGADGSDRTATYLEWCDGNGANINVAFLRFLHNHSEVDAIGVDMYRMWCAHNGEWINDKVVTFLQHMADGNGDDNNEEDYSNH